MANPLEEVAKEFQHAPPAGKALAIVALLTVAAMGIYVARLTKGSSTATSGSSSLLPIDLSGSSDTGSVPFPNFPAPTSGGTTPTPTSGGTTTTPTSGGTSGGTTPKPPVPVTGSHPVSQPPQPIRYVTVSPWTASNTAWNSTLSGISMKYYGNYADWTKIYAANKSIIGSNPNIIQPGMRLLVPY